LEKEGTLEPVVVEFDGGCQPPAGRKFASWAYVIHGRGFEHEDSGLAAEPGSPLATNNVAEYQAAIRGLEYLLSQGYRGPVVLQGDSELVLKHLQGAYRVRAPHLRPLYDRLVELARQFSELTPHWVPRELNQRADQLTKLAITRARSPADRPRDGSAH
jgi:ribonuclease HI